MSKIYIFSLLFLSIFCFSQNETAYVKQTQFGYTLKSLVAHPENPIFTKFTLTGDGVELYSGNQYTLIKFDKIEKVNTGENSYRYDMDVSNMRVSLFFNPYPYKYSNPTMFMSLIMIPGLNSDDRSIMTIFKLVFFDNMKI